MLTGDSGQVDIRVPLGSDATLKGAKGTPVVRRGRKATGLGTGSRVAEREPRSTLRGGGVSPVIRHPAPDTDESVSASKGKEPSTT